MKKADFEFLTNILREQAGWDFSTSNYYIIDKKISNYVREKNYANSDELIADIKTGSKSLLAQLVEYLALSETSFFRDHKVFENFENILLPHVREINRATKKLRIWSLGCASGQETYSIAMAVKNKFLGIGEWNIDILGTDLSSSSIAKAQHGIYNTFEVQMGLTAKQIIDNFTYERDAWRVNEDIYRMVEFRKYNLLDDITFSDKYEIIFCRNVLRFFTPEYQQKLIEKIFMTQTKGGFLFLGMHEKVEGLEKYYTKVPQFDCLYQAKDIKMQVLKLQTPSTDNAEKKAMPSFVKPESLTKRHPLMADIVTSKKEEY